VADALDFHSIGQFLSLSWHSRVLATSSRRHRRLPPRADTRAGEADVTFVSIVSIVSTEPGVVPPHGSKPSTVIGGPRAVPSVGSIRVHPTGAQTRSRHGPAGTFSLPPVSTTADHRTATWQMPND